MRGMREQAGTRAARSKVRAKGKLGCLLRVQALGLFGINRALHGGSRRDRMRVAAIAVGAVLLVGVCALYAFGMAFSLVQLGAGEAVPALAVAVGSLAGAALTFLKANGLLFGFRDFDLVMSLPVTRGQVVLSRVAPLYGMNLLLGAVLMVPMLAVYAGSAATGPLGWALSALAVLLAPLAPMAVAVGAAWVVAAVASRTRRGKIAMGALSLVLVALVVVGVVALSTGTGAPAGAPDGGDGLAGDLAAVAQIGQALSDTVAGTYPPAAWAARGLVQGDLGAFALFVAVSVVPAALVAGVLARWLLAVNSALEGGGGRARVAPTAWRARGAFAALVGKELRQLVNTPIYLTNVAVGPVLALALGVACLVLDPQGIAGALGGSVNIPGEGLDAALAGLAASASGAGGLMETVAALVPWALAFCLVIAPMSASSVSLEGAARWVMQTAPLDTRVVVRSKIAASLAVCAPLGLLGGVLAAVGLGAGPLQTAGLVLLPLAATGFAACLGAFADARRPRFDWTSEYEAVKRSFAVMATVLGGMAVVVAGAVLTIAVLGPGGTGAAGAVQLGTVAVLAVAAAVLGCAAERTDLRD